MNKLAIYGDIKCIYDLMNYTIITDIDTDKIDDILKNPNYVLCFKINNNSDFLYNDLTINYDKFPWKTYYKLNTELISNDINMNNKKNAWNHWIKYGKQDERSFSYINNTNNHRARFGNLFFINMCLHLFSIKYNLKSSYKYEVQFDKLGINFYSGSNIYKKNLLLTESCFENLLENNVKPKNIIINNNVWFHTDRFCKIINTYFIQNNIFEKVKKRNLFKNRYNNNNDLFIHLRLGDVENKTRKLHLYIENMINTLKFNKGYIASDNTNHVMCQHFIHKYNLCVINKDEVKTIMFGSTCKHIVLTGGTFSWLIGFLATTEPQNIYYPEIKEKWFGDIFRFNNWCKK